MIRPKIRRRGTGQPVAVEEPGALGLDPALAQESAEIVDRDVVDVGGRIPGLGQRPRHRHPAAPQQGHPHAPIGEIGEGHERPAADAEQLVHDLVGRARGLQRLAEDRIVECAGGVAGEIDIGVALHYRQTPRYRGGDVGGVDFDPARVDLSLVAQRRHQRAVAAADIEDARSSHDMLGDDREIGTKRHQMPPTIRR